MIVVFDTSTLIFLLRPDASGPRWPTGERIHDCQSRITYLLSELQKVRATIVIPAPTLAELLALADEAAPEWLRILTTTRYFRIVPFDTLAAVECAAMTRQRLTNVGSVTTTKRKAKFDEQIVAIARVTRASEIYSDDVDIRRLAGEGITVRGMADMQLPPTVAQGELAFDPDANMVGKADD